MLRFAGIFIVVSALVWVLPAGALATPAPTASVTLTQYSVAVSGNINPGTSGNAGASVTLTLERPVGDGTTRDIASRTATTLDDGSWSTTLAPENPSSGPVNAFGESADQLVVAYTPGTSTGLTLPGNSTYDDGVGGVRFDGARSTISADGQTVAAPYDGNGCSDVTFLIDAATPITTSQDGIGNCAATPGSPLADQNRVRASYTSSYSSTETGTTSDLTTLSDVGLLGVGSGEAQGQGAPTCTGDLVSGQVTCENLNAAPFAVSRNGGTPVALTTSAVGGANGYVAYAGSAFLPGLSTGDVLTLDETSPAATTRHLTTLHVAALRADIDPSGNASGTCQPNKVFENGAGDLCPTSGAFVAVSGGTSLFDDQSGGSTEVNVPSLIHLVPADGDSIAGGAFTASGDLHGSGSTVQVLAQTSSVHLQIVPHAGGAAVFAQNASPGFDAAGPFETDHVTGLSAGRYFANWVLTDSHFDTQSYSDLFAVQAATPGPTGPPGSPGQKGTPGSQGKAGKAGTSSQLTCVVTKVTIGKGKKRHKNTIEHCTVKVLSPGIHLVKVAITRGGRTYATGSAVVRAGAERLRLRVRRALKHGRYLVTIVVGRKGAKALVIRYHRTL
jgi:hypothetical protein